MEPYNNIGGEWRGKKKPSKKMRDKGVKYKGTRYVY